MVPEISMNSVVALVVQYEAERGIGMLEADGLFYPFVKGALLFPAECLRLGMRVYALIDDVHRDAVYIDTPPANMSMAA